MILILGGYLEQTETRIYMPFFDDGGLDPWSRVRLQGARICAHINCTACPVRTKAICGLLRTRLVASECMSSDMSHSRVVEGWYNQKEGEIRQPSSYGRWNVKVLARRLATVITLHE